jgi:hypothetical protein
LDFIFQKTAFFIVTAVKTSDLNKALPFLPQDMFVQFVEDRRFSSAIWLLFLDTNSSLEQFFTGINIPFDCQFLVAQPASGHLVALTEVYRVSPVLPLQTYRFGSWSPGGGLSWPSQGFYQRRNKLKGLVLRTAVLNVCFTVHRNFLDT